MDPSVIRAMARWPDVPAVYGWLSLDRRGRWLLRGETIGNRAAVEFISRNYSADETGCWYFQNGPQRVFVSLAYTPWVYRLDDTRALVCHTGVPVRRVEGAWMDEEGALLLATERGPGVVDDRDLGALAEGLVGADGAPLAPEALDARPAGITVVVTGSRVPLEYLEADEVPGRFGFVAEPSPPASPDAGA